MKNRCRFTSRAIFGSPNGPVVSPEEYIVHMRSVFGLTGKYPPAWCPVCGERLCITNSRNNSLKTHFRHKIYPGRIYPDS